MSHLTLNAPAIVLGAGVGVAAGLYAHRTLRQAAPEGDGDQGTAVRLPGWLLALIGGVSGALIGARFGMQARLPAYLYLVAIAPALGAVDATTRKLPNQILLPAYPASASLLGFAAWRVGDATTLWRSILAGTLLYVVFLTVALVAPRGSLGWGDVKLAGLLGLFAGFLGWKTLWLAMMVAFGTAAAYVVVRQLVRREAKASRGQTVPMGPALLLGTLVAVIAS